MGRIHATLKLSGSSNREQVVSCSALVDTGAQFLTVPVSLMEQIKGIEKIRSVSCTTANGTTEGSVYGPVLLTINSFDPVWTEVVVLTNLSEVLLGYIPLEAANIAVDMVGHRLVKVNSVDVL